MDRIPGTILLFRKQANVKLVECRLKVTLFRGGHLFEQTGGGRPRSRIVSIAQKVQGLIKSHVCAAAKGSAIIQAEGYDRHHRRNGRSDRSTVLPHIPPESPLVRLALVICSLSSLVLDLRLCELVGWWRGLGEQPRQGNDSPCQYQEERKHHPDHRA